MHVFCQNDEEKKGCHANYRLQKQTEKQANRHNNLLLSMQTKPFALTLLH